MPKAKIGELEIYYEVEGTSGGPWLTFSNSLRTDHTMWAPQIPEFARDFRILRYDVRGHGQTSRTSGFYTLDTLARDLVGLWDHLGIKKSHFCGLSLGGMTGMHLGMKFPQYIDKLVVCDCRGDSPPEIVETWKKRREGVMAKGMESVVAESLNAWFLPAQHKSQADFIKCIGRTIAETSVEGYVGCSGALCELDLAPHVATIKPKTLFVCGSNDGPHPALMKAMHNGLPGSQYALIDGGTHLSNLSHTAEFNAVVGRFLRA
jgi:3-oxoadipate enol-lactonase